MPSVPYKFVKGYANGQPTYDIVATPNVPSGYQEISRQQFEQEAGNVEYRPGVTYLQHLQNFAPNAFSGGPSPYIQEGSFFGTPEQYDYSQNNPYKNDPRYLATPLGSGTAYVPKDSPAGALLQNPGLQQQQQNATLQEVETALNKLYDAGYSLNPNAQIDERSLDEFLTIAGNEINPYYLTQLKLASDDLKRSLGYSEEQLLSSERELEQKYGRSLRTLGESAAEKGFAQSGLRQEEERQLATETQQAIEQGRRQLGYAAGGAVGNFVRSFGGSPGFSLSSRNLPGMPSVSAGESGFSRSSESPYYQISPDVYSGLVGEQEFARRGAIRSRASELETAQRTQLGLRTV